MLLFPQNTRKRCLSQIGIVLAISCNENLFLHLYSNEILKKSVNQELRLNVRENFPFCKCTSSLDANRLNVGPPLSHLCLIRPAKTY